MNESENWAAEKEAINLKGPFQSIEALKESIARNERGKEGEFLRGFLTTKAFDRTQDIPLAHEILSNPETLT